jgi:ankyrin repeat protein
MVTIVAPPMNDSVGGPLIFGFCVKRLPQSIAHEMERHQPEGSFVVIFFFEFEQYQPKPKHRKCSRYDISRRLCIQSFSMETRASTRAASRGSKRRNTSHRRSRKRKNNHADSSKGSDAKKNDLIDACILPDHDKVIDLLAQSEWKTRINECGGEDGGPALLYAVRSGDKRIVQALLDGGGDPTFIVYDGRHLLHLVVLHGTLGMLEMLLSHEDVDPNVRDYDGETPLFSSFRRSPVFLRTLLTAGADPNIISKAGISPLCWSIECGLEDHVCCLLDASANPDLDGGIFHETPLIAAISCHLTASVRHLLMAGADPNLPTREYDDIPLTLAIEEDLVDAVHLLLKAGADPNSTVVDEYTPLILASNMGDASMVELLLKAGADPNLSRRTDGSTPLFEAVRGDHHTIVQILRNAGADPNVVVKKYCRNRNCKTVETPLDLAVVRGNEVIARLLLVGGADPNVTWNFQLPLYNAARQDNASLVKLLLDFKADPNLSTDDDNPNNLPFFVAASKGYHDVVYLLLPYQLFGSQTTKPLLR